MEKFQDINTEDVIFKNDFSFKFKNGDLNGAFDILEDNPQLDSKSFVAEVINFISNTLYSIEEDYYSNTDEYLDDLSDKFQLVIDNYRYIGSWDSSVTYRIYNIVTNSNKYYMYINPVPTSGNSLSNTYYWMEFNLKGQNGADGIGIDFKGTWDSSVTYNSLDGVYYNGGIWCSKATNTNQAPSISSSYWENVVTFLQAQIMSGSSEPTNKYNGLIWIEILS